MSSQNSKASSVEKMRTSFSGEAPSQGPINIEIHGQRLTIRSDRDRAFVEGLAEYIDSKVAQLQDAAPAAPFDKLLMLASMTVAEELFEAQSQLRELRNQLKARSAVLSDLLDECERL